MTSLSLTPSSNGNDERPRASASSAAFGPEGFGLRVLVVDDERDEVLTLMAILRDDGYETRGAYRGAEAIDLVRDFAPHAILLDIGMPDLNGYDVARRIRARYGEQSPMLIAVTGWNKSADRMLAQMAGFDHHVAKPYDPQALLDLLKPLRKFGDA